MAFLLLLLMLAVMTGCGSKAGKYEASMQEKVTVEAYEVEDGETLTATVSMPDYSAYMLQFMEEAEQNAKDEQDFGVRLYALADAAAAEAENTCTREVTVSLSDADADKTDWSEAELTELVREAALQSELEEFCIELLSQSYPSADEVNVE
ncbi:MAG: hypothetical protein LUH36_00925 [Oscillospiraceae bacterium]|nr:hypothetical protein [Oscillospiraceae bacterium]